MSKSQSPDIPSFTVLWGREPMPSSVAPLGKVLQDTFVRVAYGIPLERSWARGKTVKIIQFISV